MDANKYIYIYSSLMECQYREMHLQLYADVFAVWNVNNNNRHVILVEFACNRTGSLRHQKRRDIFDAFLCGIFVGIGTGLFFKNTTQHFA